MSCQALCHDLSTCRNYSLLDADYCFVHNQIPEIQVQKKRWIKRYILGHEGYGPFYQDNYALQKHILKDLRLKKVVLTEEDVKKIPYRNKYIDIYVLLVKYGFIQQGWHAPLLMLCYRYLLKHKDGNLFGLLGHRDLLHDIHHHIILKNSNTFFDFIGLIPVIEEKIHFATEDSKFHFRTLISSYVIACLEHSEAARELSWWSRPTLDALMHCYKDVHKLTEDHPYYRCLTQRWLPDLYELHETEKQMQKIKMDQCKEELMMNRWHPARVEWLLNQGIEVENM